jgi:hypothetical protein
MNLPQQRSKLFAGTAISSIALITAVALACTDIIGANKTRKC